MNDARHDHSGDLAVLGGSFRALQTGNASQGVAVDKMSVVLVAVFAFAFLGERPELREWLGIALVGGGIWLVATKR